MEQGKYSTIHKLYYLIGKSSLYVNARLWLACLEKVVLLPVCRDNT